jgi:DNA topoisomerase-1
MPKDVTVNRYLKVVAGEDITAKDFRTWAGTVLAVQALRTLPAPESPTAAKREMAQVVKGVALRLGNTPAVCRKCYVHPAVWEAYLEGRLAGANARNGAGLSDDEAVVIALLADRPARAAA